ncbi:MAG: hypothetical protein FWC91_13580 [Defluviitaleaceae bacterium]|nr:hypothetical protein [Defluviitaleaceae bacterium]
MKMIYKKILISLIILLAVEIILGLILKYNVNRTQEIPITFIEITKIIITSIAMFIIINMVSLFMNKLGYESNIKFIRHFFLVGSIIIFIVLSIGIRNDIYNIIGMMFILPVLIISIIWLTEKGTQV